MRENQRRTIKIYISLVFLVLVSQKARSTHFYENDGGVRVVLSKVKFVHKQ